MKYPFVWLIYAMRARTAYISYTKKFLNFLCSVDHALGPDEPCSTRKITYIRLQDCQNDLKPVHGP